MANNIQRLLAKGTLAAGLAASAVTVGCSSNSAQNPHAGGPGAMPVKVLEAKDVPVSDATEYVATVKSRDSAVIMPQVEGQITQIFVHSGERVEAGSPMIEIDPLKQQATVKSQESARAAQQANLIWAKQQYERTQGLAAAGVVSKQDLDQAKRTLMQPRRRWMRSIRRCASRKCNCITTRWSRCAAELWETFQCMWATG